MRILTTLTVLFFAFSSYADEDFPIPENGMKRLVVPQIALAFGVARISIQVSRKISNGCNSETYFIANYYEKPLDESDHTIYIINNIEGPITSTNRYSCIFKNKSIFYPVILENRIRLYHGHKKHVFYIPKDAEMTYRVWMGSSESEPVEAREL
jgi:serine protease inhibitor ecotin